jgi:hypothetical protein
MVLERLSVGFTSTGVDREAGVIRGYLVAERGPFRNADRGEFNDDSLAAIQKLMAADPVGQKVHWHHPDPKTGTYPLGTFLGRAKNPRIEDGQARADLHFDKTALDTPPGGGKPLGHYVMDLAESDPSALGSSLVIMTEKQQRRGQSPLWMPLEVHGSDIVDTGEACRSLLESTPPALAVEDAERLVAWGERRSQLATKIARYKRAMV